jgi:hypothetical protein
MSRLTSTWIGTIRRLSSGSIQFKPAANFGFRAHELREIQLLVNEHRAQFLESWNEFFGIGG